MHDAMQVHFSRLASLPPLQRNVARWELWTFFAGLHERGVGLGGIMFDSIGSQRQGTALFMNSFISLAPPGDPTPAAWIRRMAFWTVVHEMGHAFNLVHAWDKGVTQGNFHPWIASMGGSGSYDLLTFMNYPYLYETGEQSDANTIRFFQNFGFRFTDDELLFLRHAPERFVIMGGSNWGTDHAFEQARVSPAPMLKLEARVNRPEAEFDFMEPVVIELKLKNISHQPVLIPDELLKTSDLLTVQVKKRWGEPKMYHPYAHYCFRSEMRVLNPGESVYESLFVSAGHDDWLIDSPGYYSIQVCLHMPREDVVSEPFEVRVTPPLTRDHEYVAQDFFSDDVGRVLTFDGSRVLDDANKTLDEVVRKFPESRVAIHAQVALGMPHAEPYKLLNVAGPNRKTCYSIREQKATARNCHDLATLLADSQMAAKTAEALGHIDYRYYVERLQKALVAQDEAETAHDVGQSMMNTLKSRGAARHVVQEIAESLETDDAEEQKHKKRSKK